MTSRLTRAIAVLVALGSVGLLSACAGAQPGVAARVGDETVSVNEVNRLTRGFCDAARRDFQGQGQVYPMSVIATVILEAMTMNLVVDQLAEDYGVETSQAFRQSQADREQNLAVLSEDQAEAAALVQSSSLYRDDVLTQIGRQQLLDEGVSEPSLDDALARGNDILTSWLSENEPEVDPQYHLVFDEGASAVADTNTSYAVTSAAVDALIADVIAERELEETEGQRFTAYARNLPASQRCG